MKDDNDNIININRASRKQIADFNQFFDEMEETPCMLGYAELREKTIELMNTKFTCVRVGSKSVICHQAQTEGDVRLVVQGYGDFKEDNLDLNVRYFIKDDNGKVEVKTFNAAVIWLKSRKKNKKAAMDFYPPTRYGDKCPSDIFNTWRGWHVRVTNNQEYPKAQKFLNHILDVICCGNQDHYQYVISWLADIVQNPGEKPGISLVIRGGFGAGKSTIGKVMKNMLRNHVRILSNPEHIIGKFNAHLSDAILLVLEEAQACSKKAEGIMKDLITNNEMNVERKGKDIDVGQRNFSRLMFISNEDWVVPAMPGERRYLTLDVSDKFVGSTPELRRFRNRSFKALFDDLNDGGYQQLFDYLMRFECIHLSADLPASKGLDNQILETMSRDSTGVKPFVYQIATEGTFPNQVTLEGNEPKGLTKSLSKYDSKFVYKCYLSFSDQLKRKPKEQRQFSREMHSLIGSKNDSGNGKTSYIFLSKEETLQFYCKKTGISKENF